MSADAIVSYALSLVDLSEGATPERYRALLFPHDSAAQAAQMAHVDSSCGLTCEAILRGSEVDGRIDWHGHQLDGLAVPYATRFAGCCAVVYQGELAQQRGLWVSADARGDALPTPGCMATIGATPPCAKRADNPEAWDRWLAAWGGVPHVLTFTDDNGGTIEGGQTDPHNGFRSTAIKAGKRVLRVAEGHLWCGTANDRGRRVLGWFQAGDLPCVPSSAA